MEPRGRHMLTEACNLAWGGLRSFTIAVGAMARKAGVAQMALFSSPGRKFARSFSPPMVVGALQTVVLFRAGLMSAIPEMCCCSSEPAL